MKSSDRPKFGNLQNLKVLNAGAVIAAPHGRSTVATSA